MASASIGRVAVLIWLAAEALAYAAFFSFFPVWAGLLVGLGSTALGLIALRLLGGSVLRAAKAELTEAAATGALRAMPYALLGAFLLLLPGFLSDLAGLCLVIMGSGALLRGQKGANRLDVELEQHEWKRLPDDPPRR